MTLFKNKYRIESARLPGWDYTAEGYYYVTIFTKNRLHYFGCVVNDDLLLHPMGEIVAEEWLRTPTLRSNVEVDEWVVMPNHMHGILVITRRIPSKSETFQRNTQDSETFQRNTQDSETFQRNVSTLKANSLGSIIGQFKGACTKRIWEEIDPEFGWQTRFWDRIIRDAAELDRARAYIRNNPLNWEKDQNNEPGLYM